MGLDDDIYTILNTLWVIATIAKPTSFHLNEQDPSPQMRNLHIQATYDGVLTPAQADNLADTRITQWEITGYEGLEVDAINCIKVIKKLLHEADVGAGHYHMDKFSISEKNKLVTYILNGHLYKEINHDEF